MSVHSVNLANQGGPAEEIRQGPLTYRQLLLRRLFRNTYAMVGLWTVFIVVFIGMFHFFLSPSSPIRTNSNLQYYPPQVIHFFDSEGNFSMRPFVYGITEEMDPNTFEITFNDDYENKFPLQFFVRGDKWSFMGIKGNLRLFGVDEEAGHYVFLLGTDNLGRDVLSRMLAGTQITLIMSFSVVALAALIGLIVGLYSGYYAGTFDLVTQRVAEFVQAFPDLPLYLALLALLPKRADALLVFMMFAAILVLLRWARFSREIRGIVFSLRGADYVRAAVAVGASQPRILARHIMPNTFSHVIVWITYELPEVILLESFLSFLGVGIQAPQISWGSMLNQILDFQSFSAAPWMMSPVVMIILVVLAFNAFGDGLRDAVDPHADG